MKKTRKQKKTKNVRARLVMAERNLATIEKMIAPYVTVRKTRLFSTAGKWREESNAASNF
jgi:hypothetical protein